MSTIACCGPVWTARSLRRYWSSALHARSRLPGRLTCKLQPTTRIAYPRPAVSVQVRCNTAASTRGSLQVLDERVVQAFLHRPPLSCSTSHLDNTVSSLGLTVAGSATSLAVALAANGRGEFVDSLLGLEIWRSRDDGATVCWKIAVAISPHPTTVSLAVRSETFMMKLYQSFRSASTLGAISDVQLVCGLTLAMHTNDQSFLVSLFGHHSVTIGDRICAASDVAVCRSLLHLLCTLAGARQLTVEPQLAGDLYTALARMLPEVDIREYLSDALLYRNVAEAVCKLRVRHTGFLDAFREHVELVAPAEDFWSPSYAGNILFLYTWMGHPAESLLQLWKQCYDSLPVDSKRFSTGSMTVLARFCWCFVAAGDGDGGGDNRVPQWLAAATGRALDEALHRSRVDWYNAELVAQCVRSVAPFMPGETATTNDDDDVIERLETRVRNVAAASNIFGRELVSRSHVRYTSGMFHVLLAPRGAEFLAWPVQCDPKDMTPAVAASLGGRPVALLLERAHLFLSDGSLSGVLARRRRVLEERGWLVACVPLTKAACKDAVGACQDAVASLQ